jgi:hypothetical protein
MLRFYRSRIGLYTPFVRPPKKTEFSGRAKRSKMPQDEYLRPIPHCTPQTALVPPSSVQGGYLWFLSLPFSAPWPKPLAVSNSQQLTSNLRSNPFPFLFAFVAIAKKDVLSA